MSDLISRADAIDAVKSLPNTPNGYSDTYDKAVFIGILEELPSAEAEPTVIRSRTLLPTKDFKEWAKRIKEVNPNAVVIPCDAEVASAEAVQGWIPCSERLPKVNQRVLLATNDGRVFVGYREKPDLVWQVTEKDGRKHWVYDPENYTDDIEILPKNEDCGFAKDDVYSDGFLSVTSVNYDDRFEGVTAWMPLPTPYKGGDDTTGESL